MADLCKQCAEWMGFPGDFEGCVEEGHYMIAICEGCSFNAIMDHTGQCVSADCLKKHGTIHIESDGQ